MIELYLIYYIDVKTEKWQMRSQGVINTLPRILTPTPNNVTSQMLLKIAIKYIFTIQNA